MSGVLESEAEHYAAPSVEQPVYGAQIAACRLERAGSAVNLWLAVVKNRLRSGEHYVSADLGNDDGTRSHGNAEPQLKSARANRMTPSLLAAEAENIN